MIELVKAIVPQIEQSLGCIIEVDVQILEEATIRASETLGHINMAHPNEVKQAGHYAFWIRKLKPLRVVNLAEMQSAVEQLSELGLIRGRIDFVQSVSQPEQSAMFINELFSIIAAIAIAKTGGHTIRLGTESLHDLATTMRYHSFSPGALVAILWANVKR